MYRILIVEDDDATAARLAACVGRYGETHGVGLACARIPSALDLPERAAESDLVFLDVELPGESGMDAALDLRRENATVPVIFVTNLAQYAVRGYEARALDFVVKPFSYEDIAQRLDRAMAVLRENAGRVVSVRTRTGLRLFPASQLVFVDTAGHDVAYHLEDGSVVSARGSLKAAWEALGGTPFLRVSSGCVVNMAHVRGVDDARLTLSTGDVVWASRANKRHCLEELARYLGANP